MMIDRTLAMSSLQSVGATESREAIVEKAPVEAGFSEVLAGLVSEASNSATVATEKADAVARGTLDDLHGTMIAVKEAEISMKLVGSIRNKLLDAFQEIWRTNV